MNRKIFIVTTDDEHCDRIIGAYWSINKADEACAKANGLDNCGPYWVETVEIKDDEKNNA